ncbi:MAG: SagB/ThcOx family dehydrogenase [Limisphaerales bacterium]
MRTNLRSVLLTTALALTVSCSAGRGQELKSIPLPPPRTEGGRPLIEALKLRRSTREFKRANLSDQALANLLWAGFGVNRPESGNRTAPSAMNSQEVDIYVALAQGLYLYDAKANELEAVSGEDLRAKTNRQPSIKDASAVLIFVADLSRLAKAKEEMRPLYAEFSAGCISQNVSLYCSSAGLATFVYDLDRAPLAAAMKLKPEQRIILAQAVGFPK